MSKSTLILVILLACAACNRQSPEPPQAAEPATATTAPAPQSPSVVQPAAQDAVTAVVAALGDKVKVRYDRVGKNASGADERQMFMEVVSGTVAEAEATVTAQLVAAGYKAGHRFEDGNGARQLYRTRNGQPVRTLARPKGVGPALKDSQAVGSIYLKR
jgi:hypothetical protein